MQLKQFWIHTEIGWKQVIGMSIILSGFEEYEFFLHAEYGPWELCEASTGMRLPPFSERYAAVTKERFTKLLAEEIELHGTHPGLTVN